MTKEPSAFYTWKVNKLAKYEGSEIE